MKKNSLHGGVAGAFFAISLVVAGPVWSGDLRAVFHALPTDTRVALQVELAEVDLFLADPDGDWNAATERALLRSVDTIALNSGDRVHPKLNSPAAMRQYLEKLADGSYATYLRRGTYSGGSALLRAVNLGG